MFGGYTEGFAYCQNIKEKDNQVLETTVNSEIPIPTYLSDDKSQLIGDFKTWSDVKEDFILLAECSETCGPVPIMTIPKKVESIDLNVFTLKLLSADYQGLGCGEGIPIKDTQLLKPDATTDIHALINYFVLLDSQARGFVRRICIAYVTCDKQKLIQNTHLLQNTIIQAATALKQNNRKLFLYELKNLLEDLKYTETEYTKELSCESSHVKLELLKSTQREVLQAYNSINHLEVDKKIEEVCEKFSQHLLFLSLSNYSQFQILNIIRQFDIPDKLYKPSIKKLPIYRNFESGLRPYIEICLNGFILGIYQLYIAYKFFRRKHENIITELKEKEYKDSVLQFGACLRLTATDLKMNILDKSHNCDLIMPDIPHSFSIIEMTQYTQVNIEFLDLFSDMNWSNSSFASTSNDSSYEKENSIYSQERNDEYVKQKKNKIKETDINIEYPCPWHGFSLGKMWDVTEKYHFDGSEYCFLEILRKFYFTQHILYSLLIGRPVVVIGENNTNYESQIRVLVKCLGLLVPRTNRKILWMELWRTLPIKEFELDNLAIVGLGCSSENNIDTLIPSSRLDHLTVLDLKCFSFTGPHYSGCLLSDIDKKLKFLPQNGPIFSIIISMLIDIEMKVQIWQCGVKSGKTIKVTDYFLNNGFTKHDFHIIQKLSDSLRNT